jgi:hypothetical protein
MGSDRSVESLPGWAREADASIDRASVVVGAKIRLFSVSDPFCGTTKAVKVRVADNRVYMSHTMYHFGGNHLGASSVLGLGAQNEARILRIHGMKQVVVVIHPTSEPTCEAVDKRPRHFVEATARSF